VLSDYPHVEMHASLHVVLVWKVYSRPTCNKEPRLVDCRISVVNKLDRRRRPDLLTTRSTCRGEMETKSGVWDKVPRSTLIFGDTQVPYNTVWDRWKEASMTKISSIRPSFRYNTGSWVTDGHDDNIYSARIASRGKKKLFPQFVSVFSSPCSNSCFLLLSACYLDM